MENTNTRSTTGMLEQSSDLSRILGENELLKVVLEAVQTVDAAQLKTEGPVRPESRPQMLLTLLTYCYASKIYGSRDIEWATRYDSTVRYICAHNFPDWQSLRRFRRLHRPLLEQVLKRVFRRAREFERDGGHSWSCGWSGSNRELEIAATVCARLDVAALMDGVESD